MKCDICNETIEDLDDVMTYYGKNLCEDCYIGELHRPKPCDPMAVSSAKKNREMMGQSGTDGLTSLQKKIVEHLKQHGKATQPDIAEALNVPIGEVQTQFGVLRHMEIAKGTKVDGKVYMTLF